MKECSYKFLLTFGIDAISLAFESFKEKEKVFKINSLHKPFPEIKYLLISFRILFRFVNKVGILVHHFFKSNCYQSNEQQDGSSEFD